MQKKIESISPAIMKGLTAWHWPGNIRELENFIERAVILTRGKSLEAPLCELHEVDADPPNQGAVQAPQDDIARIVRETIQTMSGENNSLADEYRSLQREKIVRALAESKGRIGGLKGAAARLGINRTTLFSRMKRFQIDRREFAV